MAGQEKEIGAQGLENYLNQQFPGNNRISTLMAHLRNIEAKLKDKESGTRNPFFYAEFRNQIELSGAKNLDDWIDNNGNIKASQIDVVAKIAVKKFEVVKQQEENQKRQASVQNYQEKEEKTDEQLKIEFNSIDFENLTLKDFTWIANNSEYFAKNASTEEFAKVVDPTAKHLGQDKDLTILMKIWQKHYRGEVLSAQDEKELNSLPDELAKKYNFNRNTITFDDTKMLLALEVQNSIYVEVLNQARRN